MNGQFERRRVLLGVTGSIAAYKALELARILCRKGYEVRCAMTPAAKEFISPKSFEGLCGFPVLDSFWSEHPRDGIGHIEYASWAEAYAVVPATANILAKFAAGISDCPVSAIYLATRAPVLVAPSMNVNMYNHKAVQESLCKLRDYGVWVVPPEEGELACGWHGLGRLANPWEIYQNIRRLLSDLDLTGLRVLISTGPTREALDPVRFISNRSSGKMGVALAREAFRRGAEVTLVHGPVPVKVPAAVKKIGVVSASDMLDSILKEAFGPDSPKYDIIVMAAAIADFRPKESFTHKVAKEDMPQSLKLEANPDVLLELAEKRGDGKRPVLVGFAVETGDEEEFIEKVRSKLQKKNIDMIVGNFAHEALDLDTNRVWIIDQYGRQDEVATAHKSRVANRILDCIKKLL